MRRIYCCFGRGGSKKAREQFKKDYQRESVAVSVDLSVSMCASFHHVTKSNSRSRSKTVHRDLGVVENPSNGPEDYLSQTKQELYKRVEKIKRLSD